MPDTRALPSHESAAALWGISVLVPRPGTHVVVPPSSGLRSQGDLVVHRGVLREGDVRQHRSGVVAASPLRTVIDLIRVLPPREGLVVADSALHRGLVRKRTLVAAARALRGPGAGRAVRVALIADAGGQSPFESLARFGLIAARLTPVQTQVRFGPHEHPFDLGLLPWAGVLVECDGYEFHSDRAAFRADRAQANDIAARRDLRLVRLVWEQVWPSDAPAIEAVRGAVLLGSGPRVRQMRARAQRDTPPRGPAATSP